MFQNLMYYSYEGMNIVDWMHNCAGLYKWIMKVIVGPLGDKKGSAKQKRAAADKVHRTQLQINNVFPDLWNDSPTYLDPSKAALLRSLDPDVVARENITWCKKWWKACGKKVPQGTCIDALRKQVLDWRKYLVDSPENKLVIAKGC